MNTDLQRDHVSCDSSIAYKSNLPSNTVDLLLIIFFSIQQILEKKNNVIQGELPCRILKE